MTAAGHSSSLTFKTPSLCMSFIDGQLNSRGPSRACVDRVQQQRQGVAGASSSTMQGGCGYQTAPCELCRGDLVNIILYYDRGYLLSDN
jgi:hypothetical protein